MVGQSGCRLSTNMKYVGEGTNAAKNSSYFPACSAVMMLKIEARSVCTRMRGCSLAPAMHESKKKITSKLGLGLNFAVNVSFWVCNDDFNKKTEGKNMINFLLFFYDVKNGHFCSCPSSNADILRKSLIFLCLLGISI